MRSFLEVFGKIRQSVWLSAYASVVLVCLSGYLGKFPIPDFQAKLVSLIAAGALSVLFLGLGFLVLKIISLVFSGSVASSIEKNPIVLWGVGAGTLGWAVLLLAWALPGELTTKFLYLVLGVFVFLFFNFKELALTLRTALQWNSAFKNLSILEMAACLLSALGIIASFLSCFSPITYYDSLVYHLALPSLYNLIGGVRPISFNLYSFFPGGMEMIFLFILNLLPEPEYVINLVGWMFSGGVSLILFKWAEELAGRKAGWTAFALWWSAPCVLLLSVGAYVDVPLAFFILLAVRLFFVSSETDDRVTLTISALFCGFACATKYTGGITPVILFIFLLKEGLRRPLKLPLFLTFALIPFLPWMIKNLLSCGNPFFPFLYKWLGGNVGWTKETAEGYFRLFVEYGAKSNVFLELLQAPWSLVTKATDYGGGFDVLGDFGWAIFIFASPVIFFFKPRLPVLKKIGVYFLAHFLIWFFAKPVLRFLVGALPLAVLLSSCGLIRLCAMGRKIKFSTVALVSPWLLSNVFLYFFVANQLQLFAVSTGDQERENFLNRRLVFYPAYVFMNNALGDGSKIMLLGEQRTYHLKIPFISSNIFAPSAMGRISNSAASSDDISAELKKMGITHLFFNRGEFERLGGFPAFGFSTVGTQFFNDFLKKHMRLIGEDRKTGLFELVAPSES